MKKIALYAAVSAIMILAFASCGTEKEFNAAFLFDGNGRWISYQTVGTEENHEIHFVFNSDGTGKWWDVTADMSENEAKQTEWSVSGDRFTYRRFTEFGVWGAYQDFTIIDLTATTFKYQNASGRNYLMTKES